MRKPIVRTALARIGQKNFSAACVAPRLATITISRAPNLLRYAQEATWREDNRRIANGEQIKRLAALAMMGKPSVDFSGYWQRHVLAS
jgi:hypothetical protein